MKRKIFTFLLAAAIISLLAACGEVKKVENLIGQIGTVSIESGELIKTAQDAYDALDDKHKEKVTNIQELTEAQTQYVLLQKEKTYTEATNALEKQDFTHAKELFSSLGNFKDSTERYAECVNAEKYAKAVERFEAADYLVAAKYFKESMGYLDSNKKLFDTAIAVLDKELYSDAISILNSCDDSRKNNYIAYANGCISLNNGDYEKALTFFDNAGKVSDSETKHNVCLYLQAEDNMAKGHLNTAKELYSELPGDFSYKDRKTASEMLEILDKFKSFVAICGIWNCSEMDASVRQTHTSTGLWDEWTGYDGNYTLEITCIINDDNTATVTAKANFWHYTNYSSLSRNLRYTNDSCTFKYTGARVPYKIDYKLNFNYDYSGTLSFSGQTFKLNYQILDYNSSMYFNYSYKSFGTYDRLQKSL